MLYDDAPQLVLNFLAYKGTIQGRSQKTVFQYYHDIRLFFRFCLYCKYPDKYKNREICDIDFADCTDEDVRNVTHKDIYNFLLYTQTERENRESARARKLCALKNLYRFLKNSYEIKENPADKLEAPKKKKSLPKYLTLEESWQLLTSITPPNYERDFAIITIFLNCGLRVSELEGISLNHIDSDFQKLTVTGKGSKQRVVYLNDACIYALNEYLNERKLIAAIDKNALFLSSRRKRMSTDAVHAMVKKTLKAAGLDASKYSSHKLRHTAATLMLSNGVDVRTLQEVLGHDHLNTTQIYTHVDNTELRIAAAANPLGNFTLDNED